MVKRRERLVWVYKKFDKDYFFVIFYIPSELFLLINMLFRHVDIVHIGGAVICTGAISAKVLKLPLVWHLREFVEEDHNLRWIFKNFACFLFRGSDELIAISDVVAEKYRGMLHVKENIHVVYNGIFAQTSYPTKRDILNSKTIQVSFASGLSRTKGVSTAIDAVDYLNKLLPDLFHLNIYGRGNHGQIIQLKEDIKDRGLENIIQFCGYSSNMMQELSQQDILLVCSKFEAFGRVTAEGMSAGCLVIGSDSGATKELIGENNGMLFSRNDSRNLAECLKCAANDKINARKIAKVGQKFALSTFSNEVYCANVEKIYGEI